MVGRSLESRMRRSIRSYIAGNAFVDYGKGESVNTLLERDLVEYLYSKFGACDYRVVYLFTRGEVLSDSRGSGSLQRVDDEEG